MSSGIWSPVRNCQSPLWSWTTLKIGLRNSNHCLVVNVVKFFGSRNLRSAFLSRRGCL
jgi:hypothetical protein